MPIDRPITEITEADLAALIVVGVSEGKTIEFKREVSDSTDAAKRKFLASVASFANTQGGDIVFGMNADKGVAKALCPLPQFDPDSGCIRLRDLIRAHIEPKLYGFYLHPVPLSAGGYALVLRIARTWVGAHMVTFQGDNRFYVRDGNGRRLMDVGEVRTAFAAAETLPERLRRLRLDRLSAISSGDVPIPLAYPEVLVVHVVPLQALNALHECNLEDVAAEEESGKTYLMPIARILSPLTYDLDGLLRMAEGRDGCYGYTKLFRTGYLEAIDCMSTSDSPHAGQGNAGSFAPAVYESQILGHFPKWLQAMRLARLEPPAFLALSFVAMANRFPYVGPQYIASGLRPIRHDPLLIAPTLMESLDVDAKSVLLPQFNRVWQACGMPRSINFDENGNLRP